MFTWQRSGGDRTPPPVSLYLRPPKHLLPLFVPNLRAAGGLSLPSPVLAASCAAQPVYVSAASFSRARCGCPNARPCTRITRAGRALRLYGAERHNKAVPRAFEACGGSGLRRCASNRKPSTRRRSAKSRHAHRVGRVSPEWQGSARCMQPAASSLGRHGTWHAQGRVALPRTWRRYISPAVNLRRSASGLAP